MKANELMLGDWVRLNFEEKPCFRVAQLLDDKLYVDEADFQFLQDWRYDDIEPLPITDKMLKRNDFKYDELYECYEWQQGDNTHGFTADITLVKDDRGWLCNIFGPNCGMEIEEFNLRYVHELQHLMRCVGITKEIEMI